MSAGRGTFCPFDAGSDYSTFKPLHRIAHAAFASPLLPSSYTRLIRKPTTCHAVIHPRNFEAMRHPEVLMKRHESPFQIEKERAASPVL